MNSFFGAGSFPFAGTMATNGIGYNTLPSIASSIPLHPSDGAAKNENGVIGMSGLEMHVSDHAGGNQTRGMFSRVQIRKFTTPGWNAAFTPGQPLFCITGIDIDRKDMPPGTFEVESCSPASGALGVVIPQLNAIFEACNTEFQRLATADSPAEAASSSTIAAGGAGTSASATSTPTPVQRKFSYLRTQPYHRWDEPRKYVLATEQDHQLAVDNAYNEFPMLGLCNLSYVKRHVRFVGIIETVECTERGSYLELTVSSLRNVQCANYWSLDLEGWQSVGFVITTVNSAGLSTRVRADGRNDALVLIPWRNHSGIMAAPMALQDGTTVNYNVCKYALAENFASTVSIPIGLVTGISFITGQIGQPIYGRDQEHRRFQRLIGIGSNGDGTHMIDVKGAVEAMRAANRDVRVCLGWRGNEL
jgi:hypothetical protein